MYLVNEFYKKNKFKRDKQASYERHESDFRT